MFCETAQLLKSATPLFAPTSLLNDLRLSLTQAGNSGTRTRRHLNVSASLKAKYRPPEPKIYMEIPGLERVTYGERMHFVPGLAKPVYPAWERDYKDPKYYKSPPAEEMPLYKQKPCYVFNQRTSILEGVRQALWLTKTKLTAGLPPQLLSLAQNPANQIPDQDERVQNAIKQARFWDTTESRPGKDTYCYSLLTGLLHLCGTLQARHPGLGRRIMAEKYTLAASWRRGEGLFQVRGQNGQLLSSVAPLAPPAGPEEVAGTAQHVLETFYPISPAIDLHKIHTYREQENHTGFKLGYPYPHAHTLYYLEGNDSRCRLLPEHLRAKMIMFSFGNVLARAHMLYGTEPRKLEQPITVQAVGTNGRMFQFVVFQLNTTDLSADDGIKNQVWLEGDVLLYDYAKVRPLIKKKQVKVPAGLSGYQPETFSKFLALYLHGAV